MYYRRKSNTQPLQFGVLSVLTLLAVYLYLFEESYRLYTIAVLINALLAISTVIFLVRSLICGDQAVRYQFRIGWASLIAIAALITVLTRLAPRGMAVMCE